MLFYTIQKYAVIFRQQRNYQPDCKDTDFLFFFFNFGSDSIPLVYAKSATSKHQQLWSNRQHSQLQFYNLLIGLFFFLLNMCRKQHHNYVPKWKWNKNCIRFSNAKAAALSAFRRSLRKLNLCSGMDIVCVREHARALTIEIHFHGIRRAHSAIINALN